MINVCYTKFLEDIFYEDEKCEKLIFDFLGKEICPLIPNANVTEKEIDDCEWKYFCGDKSSKNNKNNNCKTIKMSLFFILFIFIYL